jgi:hypothetical protein
MSALALTMTLLAVLAVSLAVECWALVTAGPPPLGDDLAGEGRGAVEDGSVGRVHADKLSRGSAPRAANSNRRLA